MIKLLKILKIAWFLLCLLALGGAGWLAYKGTPWLHLKLPEILEKRLGEKVLELWMPGLAVLAVWGIISTFWLVKIGISSWLGKKKRAKWMAEN